MASAAWIILIALVGELQILALWTNVMLRKDVWITKAYPHALAPVALVTAVLLAWILRRRMALLPRMMIALAAFFAVQYAIVSAGAAGNHFAAAVRGRHFAVGNAGNLVQDGRCI